MGKQNYNIHFFIDKYIDLIRIEEFHDSFSKEIHDYRLQLNRLLQRETLGIDWLGNTVLLNNVDDEETEYGKDNKMDIKLCNFFIVPTHRLYIKENQTIREEGLGIKVYTKLSKKKYKCIYLNLNQEMIEKGYWVTASFLDHDLFLYDKSYYRYLKMAIKLSTRILLDSDFKIFDGEWWFENRFSDVTINDFEGYHQRRPVLQLVHPVTTNGVIKSFYNLSNSENLNISDINTLKKQDAIIFLKEILALIEEQPLTKLGEIPENEVDNLGWQDDDKYYLPYKETWDLVETRLRHREKYSLLARKELDLFLFDEKIIEIEEEKSGRKRADKLVTVYPKTKIRVFVIKKTKMNEYLNT
ncbi:hypothetical protein [Brevibacillus parabrevis]|uniref:hypothetical protein n=1 Tax=Brevibacillus parabrevis TaxID=54914 RepID=UPI001F60CFBE|nr:hypothetical protein [Brevibacillus parabrevis]MDR4998972.1 hypothetical protein [Brevibacillus parabrevis]